MIIMSIGVFSKIDRKKTWFLVWNTTYRYIIATMPENSTWHMRETDILNVIVSTVLVMRHPQFVVIVPGSELYTIENTNKLA